MKFQINYFSFGIEFLINSHHINQFVCDAKLFKVISRTICANNRFSISTHNFDFSIFTSEEGA